MQVINLTRGTAVAGQVTLADSFGTRLVGLLGKRSLPPGAGLVLYPCSSVHTFGMRFAIDVVFIDGRGRVLLLLFSLPPYRFSPVVRGARYVLEAASGSIAGSNTREGDQVVMEPLLLPGGRTA